MYEIECEEFKVRCEDCGEEFPAGEITSFSISRNDLTPLEGWWYEPRSYCYICLKQVKAKFKEMIGEDKKS
jgi:hypothetical protein